MQPSVWTSQGVLRDMLPGLDGLKPVIPSKIIPSGLVPRTYETPAMVQEKTH